MSILLKFVTSFWTAVGEMAPYLLFGFFMAGMLSVLVSQETIEKHIGKRGLLSIIKASIFGVPLPLCSCGVVPVGMSLRKHGASRDATVAFLISTPQSGADGFMITLSMLGPIFAIVRPIAALFTGVLGGIMTSFFGTKDAPSGNANGQYSAPKCTDACCMPDDHPSRFGKFGRGMKYGFVTLPTDIGNFLFIGLLIAAAIMAIIPNGFFQHKLGSGIVPMLVMMLVGIPMYVCSSSSVPIAMALIHAGISPGAALVFLMTGPATNAVTITTIWKVLGKRTAVIYLLASAIGALGFGSILDTFAARISNEMSMGMGSHFMVPHIVETVSAVVLIGILAQSFIHKRRSNQLKKTCGLAPATDEPVEELQFRISGMTCSHCAENVTRALTEFSGVKFVNVDLTKGSAVVKGTSLDRGALAASVEQLGYTVEKEVPAPAG